MSKLFMREGLEHKFKIELTDTDGEISDNTYRKRYPAGLVRITSGIEMSRMISGEAHDGIYPLREYSRIVETEIKRKEYSKNVFS